MERKNTADILPSGYYVHQFRGLVYVHAVKLWYNTQGILTPVVFYLDGKFREHTESLYAFITNTENMRKELPPYALCYTRGILNWVEGTKYKDRGILKAHGYRWHAKKKKWWKKIKT